MIKLMVSDMDGTLLEKGKEFISDNINNIIKELKSKDIIFAIASGRHYNDLYRITKEMDGIYYICCDGGCIIYNNEVIAMYKVYDKDNTKMKPYKMFI